MTRAAFLAAIGLVAMAGPAALVGAQSARHDSTAPIDFGADHIELQDQANRVILTGNVNVRQAEMTVTAGRMTVAYTGKVVDGSPEVSRLDAAGNVVVTRPDQVGRSQYAIYDLNRRVVTMIGAVSLAQNGNNVNGARLTINLDTGHAVIDGAAVGNPAPGTAAPGTTGRVTGRFSVPKRDKPADPPTP
ncbi:LptA/OstA family protein [Sphingomonas sp.]|uniref:LptA/OstA family protein n=1 Tax=Sphingomonas sp. TaxID=28214 RepID=UPI001E1A8D18|nr:LptA/OstA family protein [Sphingomonas sp.]MBX9795755.1 LptA/OstA family protein [Sphingomonas sp.]